VQKSDGGYLYATTDLAALEHRVAVERADRVVYVTDAGQAQHFAMVFAAARKAGLLQRPDSAGPVRLQHVTFGLVLGEDGKKIRSRAGDSVRLRDLLDEAVRLAEEGELQRRRAVASALEGTATAGDELSEDSLQLLRDRARVVGLGAVKYADLSMHRESNYRFSFAKMLALSGNTAPYMLYAYVRIRGIQRKAAAQLDRTSAETASALCPAMFQLQDAAEVALAKHLLRFEDVLAAVGQDLLPSKVGGERE
jgi:arginyl-tRNA synthetase